MLKEISSKFYHIISFKNIFKILDTERVNQYFSHLRKQNRYPSITYCKHFVGGGGGTKPYVFKVDFNINFLGRRCNRYK